MLWRYFMQKNKLGVIDNMCKCYKKEDIPLICELYKQRKWDEIFRRFPGITKIAVYSLCSRRGVRTEGVYWTQYDTDFLIKNHGIISNKQIAEALDMRHSPSCVATKAKSLGLENNRYWTDEEINILQNNYSVKSFEEVLSLLPNRTKEGILGKAKDLGIYSKYTTETYYTEDQRNFIYKNFRILTDQEIADHLGKSLPGIQEQRRKLGLYLCENKYLGYDNFQKFFRAKLSNWRTNSIKNCGDQCIFTGSKDYDVHHIYSFHLIFCEAMGCIEANGYLKFNNINDYSKDELATMSSIFLRIHEKYPLGVCIRNDIHKLFHDVYKGWDNTEKQWDEFVMNYKNGNIHV